LDDNAFDRGSVLVPMVNVGIVRVRMTHRLMAMRMSVRFLSIPLKAVSVPMMLVMSMWVFVVHDAI